MHFLLTRPKDDCEILAKALRQKGHEISFFPLLDIRFLNAEKVVPDDFQALLFTSANGVRALIHNLTYNLANNLTHNLSQQIPVFTVGEASAREAKRLGFDNILSADGDVKTLENLVVHSLDPAGKALLHVAGSHMAGDLKAALSRQGFRVQRKILYEAIAAKKLDHMTLSLLQKKKISHMPFFSARTAQIFCHLMAQYDLENHLSDITALCLSPAIENVIKSLKWKEILVAEQPNQKALFKTIQITFEGSELKSK